jgi:peptide/nickel transport system ATP-binding protein
MIFQDPYNALNPRHTVGGIISAPFRVQGIEPQGGVRAAVQELMERVGLNPEHYNRYPNEFSGGQRQRIGIARAVALRPKLIVCDEPVSALDVSIQSQILNLLAELRGQFNLTYLFVAHNLSVIRYLSDRVGVMYLGKLVEEGDVDDLYRRPRHPYTVALLSAVPEPDPRIKKTRIILKGDVPSPAAPPSGCRFHTRCWLREQLGNPESCETVVPELRPVGTGHRVACHWAEKIEDSVVASALPSVPVAPIAGPRPAPTGPEQPPVRAVDDGGQPPQGAASSGT